MDGAATWLNQYKGASKTSFNLNDILWRPNYWSWSWVLYLISLSLFSSHEPCLKRLKKSVLLSCRCKDRKRRFLSILTSQMDNHGRLMLNKSLSCIWRKIPSCTLAVTYKCSLNRVYHSSARLIGRVPKFHCVACYMRGVLHWLATSSEFST